MKNKVVIVTGAASGIGKASAIGFAHHGWNVGMLDVNEQQLKSTEASVHSISPNGNHFMCECDLSKSHHLETVFKKMSAHYDAVDALFVNAGRHINGNILETSESDWDAIMDANLKSAYLTIKYALPLMMKRGGSIVLCGSDQSFIGKRRNFTYGVTKAALAQMAKSLAIDFAAQNIRVNCVCPGTIDTPLVTEAIEKNAARNNISESCVKEMLENAQPIKRIGKPEEVASIVRFLCSDEAGYVTGASWVVDGGYTAQ